ncbi:MAG: hypothetical protein O9256_04100 [Rhizobiaceae bacterium]|jgi:hypothetical protein|nr:hypothetical protein [Rhizobiaceae bacterium]
MSDILERDLVSYDPLSAVTRKERTALLGFSMLGLALVAVPLVPEKLGVFGIEFTKLNQQTFLWLYALLVGYYLAAFLVYAFTDLVAWRRSEHIRYTAYVRAQEENRQRGFLERTPKDAESVSQRAVANPVYRGLASYRVAQAASQLRALFEFALPVAFAVYVILRLVA